MSTFQKISIIMILIPLVLWGLWHLYVFLAVRSDERKERMGGKSKKSKTPNDIVANKYDALSLLEGLAEKSSFNSSFQYFCERYQKDHVGFEKPEDLRAAARMAVILAEKPERELATDGILRFLCKNIHLGCRIDAGSVSEAYRHELLTCAGWSAAALGRLLTGVMIPLDIEENLKKLSPAIQRSNEIQETLREKRNRLNKLESRLSSPSTNQDRSDAVLKEYKSLYDEVEALELTLSQGPGAFMLDNGDMPLAYLIFLLRDSQNRFPRFIKQGVIMGLVDWLTEKKSHPEAGKLLETLVSVRADMIRSDNDLTFFEVRVPEKTTRKDYALLLSDVLHCANPSIPFCDTEKLLSTAETEVPGCMDMLYSCPLRLIDPANRQAMGFYHFKPYVHAMWVQYTPPQGTGQVISRYHEVDDRTRPLSAGLNLHLFRDCYAVIPTLFHEYQHFRGDRNEASVFLKTQVFSIAFYKKYKQANAKADNVFVQLTAALGMPPALNKLDALNSLIERYYGKQLDQTAAQNQADAELKQINSFIDLSNAAETWCPDKKLPRLVEGGDTANWKLIRDVVIRFATAPKSVTEEEFLAILEQKDSSLQDLAGMPFSRPLERVCQKHKADNVDLWFMEMLDMAQHQLEQPDKEGRDEAGDLHFLFANAWLSKNDCEAGMKQQLSGPQKPNPKELQKYLQLAVKRAQESGDSVLKTKHLLFVLLQHPTKAMKAAKIKPPKSRLH